MAVQINVQANQAALAASIAAGVANFNNSLARTNQLNLQVNARGFSQPLGRITGDVKDFEAALAASNARVIAFGASTAVLGGVIRSFKELASVTIDVEKNLIDINRVFGLTTSQLQKFSSDLFQVSKQTASSFNDASKAALEFSRQGLAAEETLQRTKDALTLARVAGISYANAVDALTSTVNGFQKSGVTTTQILNKLIAVEQDFAVGAGDLSEALARTGQAAQEAGVSLDQLNALVTVAQERTARGGAVIGNALKTIFTRLQRTDTLDQLEAFNIAVRDIQGNILPSVTILQNFASAYNNLADAQRAQLSEQVAGVYQVNILKAIVGDLTNSQGVYARSLQKGASATNEAEIATAKLNQSLDALLSQTSTSAQQLANNIGKVTFAPLAKEAVSVGNIIFESLNKTLEGEGIGNTFAVGFLKGIRNLIAGPGAIAAFFTLFKLLQNSFSYLTQALPQIAGITTETQNRKNIENSILQILKGQGTASQALVGLMGNEVAQAQLLLQIARQQTAEYQTQQRLAKSLAGSLSTQGVIVRGGSGLQVTRSSGYIPASTKLAEKIGAVAGGYVPGSVVKAPSSVGGVMNTAEKVKYVPGFAQPFINPPANSQAGRSHRQNSIKRTGVDPYMYDGFIPNFFQSRKIKNLNYDRIPSILSRDVGLEDNDQIQVVSFKKQIIPLNAGESAIEYEKRVIGSLTGYQDNSKLKFKGSSAIDGFKSNDLLEVKSGSYLLSEVFDKFYRAPAENAYGYNKNNFGWNYFVKGQQDLKKVTGTLVATKNNGFIPNFAIGQFKEWMRSKGKAGELANYNLSDVNWYRNNPALVNSLQSNLAAYKAETGDSYSPAILDVFKKSLSSASSAQSAGASVLKQISEVPEIPSVGPTLNAASVVARMQNQKSFAAGYPELQAIINDPTKTQKEKDDAQNIIKQNFGKAYEKFAINKLKEIGYTSVVSAESLGLFGAKSGQTSVDAVDLATKTFFEFKGGEVENSNINSKFKRVRTDPGNFDILTDKVWKNVLVSNEYNEGAKSGNKVLYLNPAEQASEMLYLKEGLGTATKSFGPSKLSEGIIPTIEKEARRTSKFFEPTSSSGFIPNFAKFKSKYGTATLGKTDPIDLEYFSKTLGRKIKSSDIVSIEDLTTKGKGSAAGLYGDIASNIKGKGGIFGYALAQERNVDPSKAKDPLAKLKAKYPQIVKRIGLGGETFISGDYGQTVIRANSIEELIKYQDKILKMVDPAVLTLKSFSKGFIPNFAYKQSVMSLEESLSGEKAILDTKTGPFPFVRNSSQPNFAAAIADHGGLNNALSDSYRNQKNAGLMNRGFVPNFVAGSGRRARRAAARAASATTPAPAAAATVDVDKAISNMIMAIEQAEDSMSLLASITGGRNKIIDAELKKLEKSLKAGGVSASDLGGAMSKAKTEINKQQSKFGKALEKGSTTLAIAGPMLAGFAEQAAFGNKERIDLTTTERGVKSALSTGLTSITTGASIGATFGPIGAGVGAAAGALFGLTQAFKDASLTVEELNQIQLKNIENAQQSSSAASDYVSKQKELMNLISSGADQSEINKASASLSKSFTNIKDVNLAKSFADAKGDIKLMSKAVEDFDNQIKKQKGIASAFSNLQEESWFGKTTAELGVKDPTVVAASLFQSLNKDQVEGLIKAQKTRSLEKENAILFRESGGIRGKRTKPLVRQAVEASNLMESIIQSTFPALQKGSEEFNAQYKNLQNIIEGASGEQVAKELKRFLSLSKKEQQALLEKVKVEGYLREERLKFQDKLINDINNVNNTILQNEFAQKLTDAISEFQESLMVSYVDPLKLVEIKKTTALTKQKSENERSLQKIRADLSEKFFSDISKEIQSPEKIKQLDEVFTSFKTSGNIKELNTKITELSNEPKVNESLVQFVRDYNQAVEKQSKNNEGQVNLLTEQFRLESIKSANNEVLRSITDSQIQASTATQIAEIQRKTAFELQMDTLDRQMQNEARFLGLGVMGKARERNEIRNAMSVNRITDLEIQKSMGAQSSYEAVINAQRQSLLAKAQVEDAASPRGGDGTRVQAENIPTLQIKNLQDLQQAISQIQNTTGLIGEEETRRKNTLTNLLVIQEEINRGKLKEEELTKRITSEEITNARRRTSISYGLEKGFDKLIEDSDTMYSTLAEQLPRQFADNMTNALMNITKGAESVGDAFTKVATDFGSMILETIIKANMYKIIGGVGAGIPLTSQKGGYIRAQNGMYINGTGSGDRYPALLENGEYVLNRNAVMAMGGPANLDKLNFSMAPRFASGGAYSSPEYTTLSDLENNLTPQGLEQSKLYQDLYSAEKTKQEEAIRKAYERKVKRAQMIGQIAGAVAAIGASAGASAYQNSQIKAVGNKVSTASASGQAINLTKRESNLLAAGIRSGKLSSIDGSVIKKQSGGYIGNRLSDTIPAYMSGGLISQPIFNKHTPGMQYGGPSSNASSNSSLTTNNNNTSNSNSFNFAVNVNRDNKVEIGADSSSYEQKDIEFSKKMNSQVYATVLNVIKNEKRFGGSLSNTKTRV